MTRSELIEALRKADGGSRGSKACEHCGETFYRPDSGHMSWPSKWKARRFCSTICGGVSTNRQKVATPQDMRDRIKSLPVNENGCMIWQGAKNKYGYANIRWSGTNHKGHRLSFELFNGPITDDLAVCHKCDTRDCMNPEHLFLGTATENNQDRDNKGRTAKGERAGRSKLTEADVRIIRASQATTKNLAEAFGLADSTVAKIRNRRSWQHVS